MLQNAEAKTKGRRRMGEAVLRVAGVSLRGPKVVEKKEAPGTRSFTFRCPPHIRAHLDAAAESEGRSAAEVVIFAIELDRDLGVMLEADHPRIIDLAARMGLDPKRDLAKVLAGLVKHGLDKADSDSKKKK